MLGEGSRMDEHSELYRRLYEAMEQDWRDKGFSEQTMLDLDRHYAGASYTGPDSRRISPVDVGHARPSTVNHGTSLSDHLKL